MDSVGPVSPSDHAAGSVASRKSYSTVPGAKDIFKESCSDDARSNHSNSDTLPRHMKSSINPITGLPITWESSRSYEDPEPPTRPVSSRNILAWDESSASPEKLVSLSKKHFADCQSDHCPIDWEQIRTPPPATQVPYVNMLAHDPDMPPIPYRPLGRQNRKNEKNCPFATDNDDLETMRRQILQNPLGRLTAP